LTRDRLKAVARQVGGRPLAAYRSHRQRPVLSVVVPVFDVAEYLPAALDSALSQTLKDLEVVVVDDGSTDDSPRVLREYAARDYRIRLLHQDNAGQGAARNLGVEHARGEFLTFLDSDDVVPLDAYETMVEGLRASGSDFSVGNLRRLRHGEVQRIIWSRTVHRQDHLATTLDEFPEALQDIIACNRMFRTAFWRDRVGDFESGAAYEDHVPMLTAYVRARRFDVLQKVTYHWRIREDLTSTGQQKAWIGNLRDRIAVKEQASELLLAEASAAVHDAWVGRALEVDFPPFLPFALTGDEDYRALLAETYRSFLARATPVTLAHVRVAMRVRAHLAAQERWDDLRRADDWLRSCANLPPTAVVEGRLLADFPPGCRWADALPADQRELAPLEAHFEGAVEHLEWSATSLRITGWAWLRGLDLRKPTMSARLVDGDEQVVLEVRRVRLPEADEWSPLSFASPAEGGFVATVDLDGLRTRGPRSWALEVSVAQDGLESAGAVHHRIVRSAAIGASGGEGARVSWDAARGLVVDVDASLRPLGAADGLGAARLSGRSLELTVDGSPVQAALASGDVVLPARPGDGSALVVDLAAGGRSAPSGTYALTCDGEPVTLTRDLAGAAPLRLDGDDVHVRVGQRPDGRAVVVLEPPLRDDERGRVNQQRQRSRYLDSDLPVGDAVVLGGGADVRALASTPGAGSTGAEQWWEVDDRSQPVPDGSTGLLRGSREWYDALATARLLVHDDDLGPWVRRREGQRALRVFGQRPWEPLGVHAWRRAGMIEHLVGREVSHRHREWDVLLAPDEESAAYVRDAFRWAGEVLVAGSPRTDRLVTADRDGVRRDVLAALGRPEESTVVLHAPAARDAVDLAAGARDDLDVAALARELGPDFTVLRHTDPADRRPAPELTGVVDVSRHDLTDLLLTADVAVLDYSAARFDWALTGRPAVFHVPDLQKWTATRHTAQPWAETAPGPQVHTVSGVVGCVREAGTLQETWADAVAELNARFNPLNDGHASTRVLRALA
jgi:glycosyltransferase involved in cell wall biosynthesis/CDP-glycerol glycerophosphotransferase (TagB/SpsB family)